jgi:putative peptidoglycan lipid II flippase
VSFTLAALSLASKPMGCARTLLIAWAFGTSAGMDSFHLAQGIIGLFAGSIGNTLENAVMPELVRLRERGGGTGGACRATAAMVSCFVLLLAVAFAAVLAIAPGILIMFFAKGFEGERTVIGARMLWWLLPCAVVTMYRPTLDIWANVTERYTLSAMVSTLFNVIAIPALLISIPLAGIYGAAFSMSAGHAIVCALFLLAMRGAPIVWRAREVAWGSVKKICASAAHMMIIIAAGTLYNVVDRYFASGLPVGSVAAISYAGALIGVVYALAATPMPYFLSIITKSAATEADDPIRTVKSAAALSLAYLMPASMFIAASSRQIISLVFGWGNFGADSVAATSVCLASYSAGFAFSSASGVIYRYALATGRLRTIAVMTYFLIGLNAALDWLFVRKWGLLGLSLATSATQIAGFIAYYAAIIDGSLVKFLKGVKFFQQTAAAGAMALLAWYASRYGTAASLAASAALFASYLMLAERTGLMSQIPPGWRPSQLWRFILSAAKSYARPGQKG